MIKIPIPVTGGYSHMGDCMIFLAVFILGRKNGAIAAFASTPNICIQTTVGVVIFMLLSKVLESTIEKL